MVNTLFKVIDSSSVLSKFAMHAVVVDIENRNVILGLSWLMENGFLVNTQHRCLRNVNTAYVILCSLSWMPAVLIMEEKPLVDGRIFLIMDGSKRYYWYLECFSAERAARLPIHKSWDHQITLQDLSAKVPTGAC